MEKDGSFVNSLQDSFKQDRDERIKKLKAEGDEITKANGYKRPVVKRGWHNLNGRSIISVDEIPFFTATAAARYITKKYKMTAEHAMHFVMEEF